MKYLFTIIAIFSSFSLFARLNERKLAEAMASALAQSTKEIFYYKPQDPQPDGNMRKTVGDVVYYGPYILELNGIPPGTRFKLFSSNLDNETKPLFTGSGYIDQEGKAHIKLAHKEQEDRLLSSILAIFSSKVPGERFNALVVLEDNTYLVAYTVPNSIEDHDQSGRYVTMELFSRRIPQYVLRGENFKPNEEIFISIPAKDGPIIKHLIVSKMGTFGFIIERQKGTKVDQQIAITTLEQDKPMTLNFSWKILKN